MSIINSNQTKQYIYHKVWGWSTLKILILVSGLCCNQKVLESFFESWSLTCLTLYNKISSHFFCHLFAHPSLCPLTTYVLPKKKKVKEKTHFLFSRFVAPIIGQNDFLPCFFGKAPDTSVGSGRYRSSFKKLSWFPSLVTLWLTLRWVIFLCKLGVTLTPTWLLSTKLAT